VHPIPQTGLVENAIDLFLAATQLFLFFLGQLDDVTTRCSARALIGLRARCALNEQQVTTYIEAIRVVIRRFTALMALGDDVG
jgi:hypothetical protein